MPHRQIQLQSVPGLWPPTWPMGLTMLRLLLLPVFLFLLLVDADAAGQGRHAYRWLAVGVFAVMAITDKLDGYLARRLNQTSKLGTILDPIADKLLVASSVVLLSFDYVAPKDFALPLWVVLAIYGKDVIVVTGTGALVAVTGKATITPRPLGKLSTFLQLSMIIATLLGPDLARLSQPFAVALTRGLWLAVTVTALASTADYVIQGFAQYRQERGTKVKPADRPA